MNRTATLACVLAVGLVGPATTAHAQACGDSTVAQSLQYLRRLSFDLRGRLPDMAELDSVVTNGGELDPTIIDGIVASEELVEQLREHHRELLWLNIADLRIGAQAWNLGKVPRTDIYLITANGRAVAYRGGNVACLDEPARFGPGGEILTTPDPNDASIRREGWVEVAPYWAPTTRVKVCAFDAQETLEYTRGGGRRVDCSTGPNDSRCGCGPELQWCHSVPDDSDGVIKRALSEQALRFMDQVVREGRPYHEILTSRELEVNGPISHYLRHQATANLGNVYGLGSPGFEVPVIPFAAVDTWVRVTRDAAHAGVLTLPAFLLKFQSDRGRANRFYDAFLCTQFVAPPGGLPSGDDPCTLEPDLTKRCGCNACHAIVEPAAAYWGRWAEAGFAPLPEAQYPKIRPECATPEGARTAACRRLYFTDPQHPDEEAYRGYLRSYVFADARREANIAVGPRGLADTAIDSGLFARCAAQKLLERYLGRPTAPTEVATVTALGEQFVREGYDVRRLVKSIVTRPEYSKAGRYEGGAR